MNFANQHLNDIVHDLGSGFDVSKYDEPTISVNSVKDQLEYFIIDRDLVTSSNDITVPMWVQLIKIMWKDPLFSNECLNQVSLVSCRVFFANSDGLELKLLGKYIVNQIIDTFRETIQDLINDIIDNASEEFKREMVGAYPVESSLTLSSQQAGV